MIQTAKFQCGVNALTTWVQSDVVWPGGSLPAVFCTIILGDKHLFLYCKFICVFVALILSNSIILIVI